MVPVCNKRYHIYNRFCHFWAEIKKLWNYPLTTCQENCSFAMQINRQKQGRMSVHLNYLSRILLSAFINFGVIAFLHFYTKNFVLGICSPVMCLQPNLVHFNISELWKNIHLTSKWNRTRRIYSSQLNQIILKISA